MRVVYAAGLAMVLVAMVTDAYKVGPPVDHAAVCDVMSPIEGHHVEPKTSRPPFAITVEPQCYKHNEALNGTHPIM